MNCLLLTDVYQDYGRWIGGSMAELKRFQLVCRRSARGSWDSGSNSLDMLAVIPVYIPSLDLTLHLLNAAYSAII